METQHLYEIHTSRFREVCVFLIAIVANAILLFIIRPISGALGLGHSSAFADLVEVAPLAVVCLIAGLGLGRPLIRAGTLAGAILVTATISSAHALRGALVFPSQAMLLEITSELATVFIPACMLIAAVGSYTRFRFGPAELTAQRLTVAGLLYSTAILAVTLTLWAQVRPTEIEAGLHGRVAFSICVVAPATSVFILFAAWCGQTILRCAWPIALALATIIPAVRLGTSHHRPMSFLIGLSISVAWISVTTLYLRLSGWRLTCRGRQPRVNAKSL